MAQLTRKPVSYYSIHLPNRSFRGLTTRQDVVNSFRRQGFYVKYEGEWEFFNYVRYINWFVEKEKNFVPPGKG